MSEAVIDTLLHPSWVLPIAANGVPTPKALQDHSVAISGNKIVALGPRAELAHRAPTATNVELPWRLLTPGLINAHTHAAMTLLRGWAEDLPLQPWLFDRIFPTESRRLAIAEMLLSGTTCFADMYFYPEAVAREAKRAGIRAQLAFPIFEQPTAWSSGLDDALARGFALHDAYKNDSLVNIAFGPHAVYSITEDALQRIHTYSQELFLPVQIHLHESAAEVSDAENNGERHLNTLNRLGLLNPALQAVHMTQLRDPEIELLAATATSVVHCPASNMKLASGACPVRKLLDAGVTLGLGTDGAASSNSLDMLQAARLMGLLAKHDTADASNVSAFDSLLAATLGGAKALGQGDRLGSIEPGKQADLVAFDLSHPAMLPLLDPVAQLVHTEAGGKVTDVWVAGKQVVAGGALTTIDTTALAHGADHWQTQVLQSTALPKTPDPANPELFE